MFFVNKSAKDANLSRSELDESLLIRRFVRRQINRRRQQLGHSESIGTASLNERSNSTPDALKSAFEAANTVVSHRQNYVLCSDNCHHRRTKCRQRWVHYTTVDTRNNHSGGKRSEWQSSAALINGPIPLYYSLPQHLTWTNAEKTAMRYFTMSISDTFRAVEDATFWQRFLLPYLESDIWLRFLAVSFALFHQSHEVRIANPQIARERANAALIPYNRAIKMIYNNATTMSKSVLDISCILIVSIEILQGNLHNASACLNSGLSSGGHSKRKLIQDRWKQPIVKEEFTPPERAIRTTQAKMAGAFLIFNPVPSPLMDCDEPNYVAMLRRDARPLCDRQADLNTLAEKLYVDTLRTLNHMRAGSQVSRGSMLVDAMLEDFEHFHQSLAIVRLAEKCSATASRVCQQTRIPEMKVLEAQVVFNCVVLDQNEMSFDKWSPSCQRIVDIAQQCLLETCQDTSRLVYHPFSSVFIPPLWLVASRCRVYGTRSRAIHLLHTYRRREKAFDSIVTSRLALYIMLQEHGVELGRNTNAHVPLERRVRLLDARASSSDGMIELTFKRVLMEEAGHGRTLKCQLQHGSLGIAPNGDSQCGAVITFLQALLIF